jgi:hypothetical protein
MVPEVPEVVTAFISPSASPNAATKTIHRRFYYRISIFCTVPEGCFGVERRWSVLNYTAV